MTLSYVEGTSKLRSSLVILPEYKDFFDRKPTDNDWIGLPDGKADEKDKWLFGLAPSFSEYGSDYPLTKIDPEKEIEGFISLSPTKDIPGFHSLPITVGDLTNIPDLKARWYFNNIFYLRPPGVEDRQFIDEVFSNWEGEGKVKTVKSSVEGSSFISNADVDVPTAIKDNISAFTVYVGGDSRTNDQKLWTYCRERQLVNYDAPGSIFLLLSMSFRTKSIEHSLIISEKTLKETDRIVKAIEERISKALKTQFKRMTLERRNVHYDYVNNRQ